MARRVRPGEKLNITAAEYNRLLAAADALLVIASPVAEETAPTFATLPPFAFTIKVRHCAHRWNRRFQRPTRRS